ncbi:hypothetical protein SAMN02745164_00094 [Marinitoga hydrogenitolerans DSM 16785]|uniref:Polymerase/histidinol phosphatase N-terminal domain-containing protein n=1 Tax=Marinitoga hydrogenitolerans (strain DSM 16785 / JCM 12826 / AT1271) TaxID=1122195 RepID=A0A1M4S6U6_MARH1|nr:CehA/McbA family metallohydrolase [Marinitoga hydrogenitolerans]SHE27934.1 hypothetical protein SAMN02745164_00094 [Marinitoga hydrogenitolerans DSM 16785]
MKRYYVLIFLIINSILIFSFPNDLILLFGNPHSHTSFSDGEPGTIPEDAYKYARDVANIDFLAVTDHAYYFEAKYNNRDKFEVMKEMAEKETTKNFVALAGFEWTSGSGHINVFQANTWTSRNVKTTTEEFYNWLVNEKAVAQFNHPISMFGIFKNFEYYPEVDQYINLIEVGNGSWSKNDTINDEMFSNYILALKKGWHVGATVGQDNHAANWGTGNDSRTALWVKSRTKKEILNSFFNRKTYGTEDKNVKLWIETNKAMMGDIYYYNSIPENIKLNVYYKDPDKENVKKLKIYTPNNLYVFDNLPFEFEKEIEIPIDSPYFFVFASLEQEDGDKVVSTAIWYESKDGIRLFDLPKTVMYKNSGNNYNFYLYNVLNKKSSADIKIYIDDSLKYDNKINLSSFEKRMINTMLKTPDKDKINLKIYINNLLWYENDIILKDKIIISAIDINPEIFKGKYTIKNNLSENSYIILISSSALKDEIMYNKIVELSKNKRIGIVLDEINENLLNLIPTKYEITTEKFNNKILNKLYFNNGFKILFKGKERGFILNKNYVIFTGNPFESAENEVFLKKLLKIK